MITANWYKTPAGPEVTSQFTCSGSSCGYWWCGETENRWTDTPVKDFITDELSNQKWII